MLGHLQTPTQPFIARHLLADERDCPDHLRQIEPLHRQEQLAPLAARQIEHVADQAIELLRGDVDARQILAVRLRQRRAVIACPLAEHHLAQADEQHERRAQLVTHHRKESALEAVGFLGQPPAVLRCLLGHHSLLIQLNIAFSQHHQALSVTLISSCNTE